MKKDRVFIIGGGTSLKGFDFSLLKNEDCIAINKSIRDVPWAKYFITMDYTIRNKLDLDEIFASKFFVVSLVGNEVQETDGKIINVTRNRVWDLRDYDVVIKSKYQEYFGFNWNTFCNGANSGYGAIQLAVLLRYSEIYLLGIDLFNADTTHYHEGYKKQNRGNLDIKWEYDYDRFKDGLEYLFCVWTGNIYSCSEISKLNNIISYKPIKEIL